MHNENPLRTPENRNDADADARQNLEHTLGQLNGLLDQAAAERAEMNWPDMHRSETNAPETTRAETNHRNAQKSTGPRTEAGKSRSRFNALRHGLSGRTVLLPSEDIAAYKKFTEDIVATLRPENPVEQHLAQTVADTYWRLNRARAWEDSLLALGSFENGGTIDADCPRTHTALTSAAAYRQHNQAFANLTVYEQRLSRLAERTLKQLQELQAKRKEEFEDTMDEAIRHHKQHEMLNKEWDPAEDGFVYTKGQVEAERRRRARSFRANEAFNCGYNLEKYQKKMAA